MFRANILSYVYRFVRRGVIFLFRQWDLARKQTPDLEQVIDWGDDQLKRLDQHLGSLLYHFEIPENIETEVFDLRFPSPLIISSFKDDVDVLNIWLKMGAGGFVMKTLLSHAHLGHARPRIQEVMLDGRYGLINAMGLPGKGVEYVVKTLNQKEAQCLPHRPIGISIGGRSLQEYKDNFMYVHQHLDLPISRPFYYEVNISCPNMSEEHALDKDVHVLRGFVSFMREQTDQVIAVKLSPDQDDQTLLSYVECLASFERVFVNVGNTQYRSKEELGLSEEVLSRPGGGLSGSALFERTCAMVELLSDQGIPVMATGGVSSAEDVQHVLGLGACLVGVASGVVCDPYLIPQTNEQLSMHQERLLL